jgi:hypothetical protein
MSKSEILSWRLSPDLKVALERRARMEGRSVSGLLDRVVQDWLRNGRSDADDEAEQARLHREVAKYIGTMSGGNPRRAETARETIRERLRKAHERRRPR